MKGAVIFRLFCITMLWLLFCWWLIDRMIRTNTEFTLLTLFPFVASGIIVFVPLYKKYVKPLREKDEKSKK